MDILCVKIRNTVVFILETNIVLLGKWLWKVLTNVSLFWIQFISKQFYRRKNIEFLFGSPSQKASSFWKGVWRFSRSLREGLRLTALPLFIL